MNQRLKGGVVSGGSATPLLARSPSIQQVYRDAWCGRPPEIPEIVLDQQQHTITRRRACGISSRAVIRLRRTTAWAACK
jgi:hypothetical protein